MKVRERKIREDKSWLTGEEEGERLNVMREAEWRTGLGCKEVEKIGNSRIL